MQLGLSIAVALLIVAVVAWPLLAGRRRGGEPPAASPAADDNSAAALDAVYDAIRTLQTEHSLGRVSDADFREQRDEYRRQAAVILRDLDNAGRKRPPPEQAQSDETAPT